MAANSKIAVATHIMATLALKKDEAELVTSNYLGESINTNPVVVRRILSDLQKAGLVESLAGKSGGARLAKAASQISLQDIYSAVDDGSLFALNPNEPNKKCPISCVMRSVLTPIFDNADKALATQLKRTKLSDVVKEIQARAHLA